MILGATGPRGHTGATGARGPQGYTGATGKFDNNHYLYLKYFGKGIEYHITIQKFSA